MKSAFLYQSCVLWCYSRRRTSETERYASQGVCNIIYITLQRERESLKLRTPPSRVPFDIPLPYPSLMPSPPCTAKSSPLKWSSICFYYCQYWRRLWLVTVFFHFFLYFIFSNDVPKWGLYGVAEQKGVWRTVLYNGFRFVLGYRDWPTLNTRWRWLDLWT